MSWTTVHWEAFCALLEESWPGDFDDQARRSWRVMLDGTEPDAAVVAMRRLLVKGQRFRPSISEFMAALRHDPGKPTFDEAYRLIFGRGGVILTPPPAGRFPTETHRRKAHAAARMARAAELHPLITTFIQRQGLARLAEIRFGDPKWGEKRRADLQVAWEVHVEAFDDRQVAALAAGDSPEGLHRFDPLAVLGLPKPVAELEQGDESEAA